MRLRQNPNEGSVGFQIALMIDVMFVIMLFFMVMAGAVQRENELKTSLPGSAETSNSVDFVDEQGVAVCDASEVSLNEDPVDSVGSKELLQLTATLMRLKQSSEVAKTPLAITIACEPQAKYGRAIDVLNALAAARISNVTFTVNEEE